MEILIVLVIALLFVGAVISLVVYLIKSVVSGIQGPSQPPFPGGPWSAGHTRHDSGHGSFFDPGSSCGGGSSGSDWSGGGHHGHHHGGWSDHGGHHHGSSGCGGGSSSGSSCGGGSSSSSSCGGGSSSSCGGGGS